MSVRAPHTWAWSAFLIATLSGLLSWALYPVPAPVDPGRPQAHQARGYTGSAECKACHPGAYATWSQTYHKTMTRSAEFLLNEPAQGPVFPVSLELDGVTFTLRNEGGHITVHGPDLHSIAKQLAHIRTIQDASATWRRTKAASAWSNAPLVSRNIVLVTGSHHYLALWVSGGEGSALRQLPHVYFLDEQRWIPRREAFLQPPDAAPHIANFNANCIQCHTVAGRPRQSEGTDRVTGAFWERYASDTADLGIACEACHGPGQAHAAHFRTPWARYGADALTDTTDAPQPYDMFVPDPDHASSSNAACGQCHSYFVPRDPDKWWDSGFSETFRAGDALDPSRTVLEAAAVNHEVGSASSLVNAEQQSLFWADGSIMVGGREYNGLVQSPCTAHGRQGQMLSCVSCHSMHQGTQSGQISKKFAGQRSNDQCSQCHTQTPAHSRHQPDSPGALCVNCHMPKTSYALLSATRSHQISSPRPISAGDHQPPQACALCHTDRSISWLNDELARFERVRPIEQRSSAGPNDEVPWAIHQVLSGHAATRAIFTAALSSPESLQTAGRPAWDAVVETLLRDEYAAVAHMARRAQARLTHPSASVVPRAAATFRRLSAEDLRNLELERDHRSIIVSE